MAAFKLPRSFHGWMDRPEVFPRYWDEAMGKIETFANDVLAIPEIQAALAALAAATTAATDATAAQARENSLVRSYVDNFTPPLVSADSAGNVTIATHYRVYGDPVLNPTVSVTGATIPTTGVTDDVIRVYYNDPTRAGGGVTYLYTVDPASPPVQSGDLHSVAAVQIPAAGSNDGNYVQPPGYVPLS